MKFSIEPTMFYNNIHPAYHYTEQFANNDETREGTRWRPAFYDISYYCIKPKKIGKHYSVISASVKFSPQEIQGIVVLKILFPYLSIVASIEHTCSIINTVMSCIMEIIPLINMMVGDMFEPEMEKLAEYLQVEFNKFYEEATVKSVNCPDLTKAPFHLIAPGLCGNTALLEAGSLSNLFPFPRPDKIYDFKSFLHASGRYNIDNFIIGAGLHRSSNGHIGELIMNASFSPSAEGRMEVKNSSYVAFLGNDDTGERIQLDTLTNYNPKCFLHGNFFISEGKSGRVLKIQAKTRREDKELTKIIQHTLQKYYEATSIPVGLGGVFVMHNGLVQQHVMPGILKDCSSEEKIRNWVKYYALPTPSVAVGTIVNQPSFRVVSNTRTDLQLTTNHFHSFSLDTGVGGHYYTNVEVANTAEYLGYFCPAKKLYRVDDEEIVPILTQF